MLCALTVRQCATNVVAFGAHGVIAPEKHHLCWALLRGTLKVAFVVVKQPACLGAFGIIVWVRSMHTVPDKLAVQAERLFQNLT